MQVSIAGRTTGTITMSAKADGGEAVEAITDGTINVGNYSFTSLPKDFYYYENATGKWYGLRMNVGGSINPVIKTKSRRFPWQSYNKL